MREVEKLQIIRYEHVACDASKYLDKKKVTTFLASVTFSITLISVWLLSSQDPFTRYIKV